jgi:hypothetical protein
MTDTTIRPRRNYHKISTGIIIASAILLSLVGVASHFLKPKGYLAFEPIAFGSDQPVKVEGDKLSKEQNKFESDKKLAEAPNPPLPGRNPFHKDSQ